MTPPTATTRPARVFVSHSHADNDFCRRLVRSLTAAELDVWYDERNAGPGSLASTVERELRRADAFLLILSPTALTSQWVESE